MCWIGRGNGFDIIKPSRERTLPDILTREETLRLINTLQKLRYRVFIFYELRFGVRVPGSSNQKNRSWLAPLAPSILIRWATR
jgi:hypothetical protein